MSDTPVPLNVVNMTPSSIWVTGSNGTDLTNINKTPIPPGASLVVADFNYPDSGNNWDWVYLTDKGGDPRYQIYVQVNHHGGDYAYFGYYDPASTKDNSNPSPFPDPDGPPTQTSPIYSAIYWPDGTTGPTYYLMATPPWPARPGTDIEDSNYILSERSPHQ